MKTEIIEVEKKDEYPKLMISGAGVVVLFRQYKTGVCLRSEINEQGIQQNGHYEVGKISSTWSMGCFQPFYGKLVLSNE